MKQEFIDFLNALMAAAPEVANEKMTDNVKAYIDTLISSKNDKPEITDSGKIILDYIPNAIFSVKIIPMVYIFQAVQYRALYVNW